MGWKTPIQRLLRAFGYQLRSLETLQGSRAVEAPREYMRCEPFSYRTYAPWFTQECQRDYSRIGSRTLVTEDRCYVLRQLARHASRLPGRFAECGVYKGGTARWIAESASGAANRLDLFDTFTGMPGEAESDPSGHRPGDFGDTSLEAVRAYLADLEGVRFFPGRVPESFRSGGGERYAFVHVDVDLYQSVRDCCEFFTDRLAVGGVLVFDDYGFERYRHAARRAVDEFFEDRPEFPISLRNGQCLVFRLPE